MNIATAIPAARFNALLVEVEGDKSLDLEPMLHHQGCHVRKALIPAQQPIQASLEGIDLLVLSGLAESDVVAWAEQAIGTSRVLVVTPSVETAIQAARLGAATVVGTSIELAAAQIGQLIDRIESKRHAAGHDNLGGRSASSVVPGAPTSGTVQRRSTPLPRDAAPEAFDALLESAEALLPMHKFQRVYVDYALRRFGGNKVHTAAALGIDRRTIQRWARARFEPATTASARELGGS